MEIKEIFAETGKLGNEIDRLGGKLQQVYKECLEMMELCPHEIVFKYNDNHPRKMMIDGIYYCPSCGKVIRCIKKDEIKDTPFKDSQIIPLIDLSLLGTPEFHRIMRNEVYENMDIYYNSTVSTQKLSTKMEELLKDKQYKYESPLKVFKMR